MLIFTPSLEIMLIVMQYKGKGTYVQMIDALVKTQYKNNVSAICNF